MDSEGAEVGGGDGPAVCVDSIGEGRLWKMWRENLPHPAATIWQNPLRGPVGGGGATREGRALSAFEHGQSFRNTADEDLGGDI